MARLTKITTRRGDDGYTDLHHERLAKDDVLVEAIGALDELNAHIGYLLSHIADKPMRQILLHVQQKLFDIGANLHEPNYPCLNELEISALDKAVQGMNEHLPPLTEFVLPQGNAASAYAHVTRTVCRRVERRLVALHHQKALANACIVPYINRLSDLLFVIARMLARATDEKEILWEPNKN